MVDVGGFAADINHKKLTYPELRLIRKPSFIRNRKRAFPSIRVDEINSFWEEAGKEKLVIPCPPFH